MPSLELNRLTKQHLQSPDYLIRPEAEHEFKLTTDRDTIMLLAQMESPFFVGGSQLNLSERTYFFPARHDGKRKSITRIREEDGSIYFRYKKKLPISAGADKHMLIRDEIITDSLEEAMVNLGMSSDQEIPQSPPAYKTGIARNIQMGDCLIEVAAHSLWIPEWDETLYQTELELAGINPGSWSDSPDPMAYISDALKNAAHLVDAYYKLNGIESFPAMTSKSEWVKEKMGITSQ